MIASSVDLPQPDGPNTTTNSPRFMVRSTPSRTRVSTLPWRKDFVTSSIKIRGKFNGGFDLITCPPSVWQMTGKCLEHVGHFWQIPATDTLETRIWFDRFCSNLFNWRFALSVKRATLRGRSLMLKK